jgi:cobalt-zinc-cadmium efflux system outer membrane protein
MDHRCRLLLVATTLSGLTSGLSGCSAVPVSHEPLASRPTVETVPSVTSVADAPARTGQHPHLEIRQVSAEAGAESQVTTAAAAQAAAPSRRRFDVPADLPGGRAAPLRAPVLQPGQTAEQKQAALDAVYGLLPVVPEDPLIPTGVELTLEALENMASQYSPVIQRAAADVDRARGLAWQAGLYPNPRIGYQADTVGTADTNGYHGGFISQEFVTAGKLTLAQQAALRQVCAAELALTKTRIEVLSNVRREYFAVLIAQERLRLTKALAKLTEDAWNAQKELVQGGEAAAYEPMQLRVQALQARNAITRAGNDLVAGWRRLAAATGQPDLSPAPLGGSVEQPVPEFDFTTSRAWMEANHTDMSAAQNEIVRASYELNLQQVTPIPNLDVAAVVQRDYTAPQLDSVSWNLQIGFPVPVYNRNEGNIAAAEAEYMKASHTVESTRNELVSELAEAFQRYQSARQLVMTYRLDLLPSQVQASRGVYQRFQEGEHDADFAQVVVAQQSLAQLIQEYLDLLEEQWVATVDVARILQQEQFAESSAVEPVETPH